MWQFALTSAKWISMPCRHEHIFMRVFFLSSHTSNLWPLTVKLKLPIFTLCVNCNTNCFLFCSSWFETVIKFSLHVCVKIDNDSLFCHISYLYLAWRAHHMIAEKQKKHNCIRRPTRLWAAIMSYVRWFSNRVKNNLAFILFNELR